MSLTDVTTMALTISLVTGLSLLAGRGKLIVFSHAAFYGLGAYTTAVLNVRFGAGFAETVIASGVVAGLGGVVVGLPAFRTAGVYFAMVSWSLAVIVQTLFANLEITGGPFGIGPLRPVTFAGLSLADLNTVCALAIVTATVTVGVTALITHSRIGWAIRALGEDERAAQSLGVRKSYVLLSFVLISVLAGVAGSIYAYFITYVFADPFNIDLSILLLVAAIVGGLGSLTGGVVGTLLILTIRNALRDLPFVADILFGCALVAIIHLRPTGLIPIQAEARIARALGRRIRPLPGPSLHG